MRSTVAAHSRLSLFLAALLCASDSYGQTTAVPAERSKPTLRERALKGDAEAQFNLGKMYEGGRGGLKKDYAQAAHWYRRAAEQGDPWAQASLGILFRFGKGVPQDIVQAYMWFHVAASQTRGGEQESIAEMRDAAAARMTPQQLAEARRLASEWKPNPAP